MDTQGSIRASLKGAKSRFRSQQAEPAVLETAKQFLESLQFDMRIRRLLHPDKMEQSIGKYVYYCLGNEQRYEPGYIVCMKGHPALFVHGRLQFAIPLRLRLHASVYQKEAVFVGTLDTIHASLRLEDVFYYEGKNLYRDPYSKRIRTLKHFYENAFVQDERLSGLTVNLATPKPLSQLREFVESGEYYSIDLIPEIGGRGRFHLALHPHEQKNTTKKQEAPISNDVTTSTAVAIATPISEKPVPVQKTGETHTYAFAHKISGLPDTYELRIEDGSSIGKAAVQHANVSIQLRQLFAKPGTTYVKVTLDWHEDFQRYKIKGIFVD